MRGPLHGIRVIEIEAIGPAPFSGMHLADLGADVILVERKHRNSDPASQFPVGILKRGKRSIVLDFKTPDDLQTVLDLIKTADALIEGMRPGVMERLGLGPEICMQSNPGLVYARMTGWGQHGPLSKFAGHDINYAAITSAFCITDWAVPSASIFPASMTITRSHTSIRSTTAHHYSIILDSASLGCDTLNPKRSLLLHRSRLSAPSRNYLPAKPRTPRLR